MGWAELESARAASGKVGGHGLRVIHGVEVADHQRNERRFSNETSRWRTIVEALHEIRRCVPVGEKGLYATLTEAYAYAESRRKARAEEAGIGRRQMDLFGGKK